MDSARASRLLLIDRDAGSARSAAIAVAACFVAAPAFTDARSGREASEMLRAQSFDLVLADLQSLIDLAPQTEDAVTRLAKLGGTAMTIVLTDDASVSAAVAAMRAGAHDVIGRPLAPATLAARLGQLALRHGKSLGLVVDGIEVMPTASYPAVLGMSRVLHPQDVLPMWRQEQKIIEDAIASFGGNIGLAAAALELSPSTIYRKRQAWAEAEMERKGAA